MINLFLTLTLNLHSSIMDLIIGKGKPVVLLCMWVLVIWIIINIFYIITRNQKQN